MTTTVLQGIHESNNNINSIPFSNNKLTLKAATLLSITTLTATALLFVYLTADVLTLKATKHEWGIMCVAVTKMHI